MKWQQREYSPQQMQQMQQEALERVRQMQQRSQQVLKRPSHPPSFFVEPQQLLILGLLWLLYSDHCTDNTLMLALLYLFL